MGEAFRTGWSVVKGRDVHATKNRCDLCSDSIPSGTGAHIETAEGGDWHWVCGDCAKLYDSDDDAFQDKVAQAKREGA